MPNCSVFFKEGVSSRELVLFGEGVTQPSEHMSSIRSCGKDARTREVEGEVKSGDESRNKLTEK